MYFVLAIILISASMFAGSFLFKSIIYDGQETAKNFVAYLISLKDYLDNKLQSDSKKTLAAGVSEIWHEQTESDSAYAGGKSKSMMVLLYHGITPKADRFNTTEEKFKEHMFALKAAGYQTVTLEEFYEFVTGRREAGEKEFLLTFDDGRYDSYAGADPVLKTLGYSAVMYVTARDSLNPAVEPGKKSFYLNLRQIKKMLSSGRWEIGSHAIQEYGGYIPIDERGGLGNFLSNKMWLEEEGRVETDEEYIERVRKEIVDSKLMLEKALGTEIASFSYPLDDYGHQTLNYATSTEIIETFVRGDYKMAFKQAWPEDVNFSSNYSGEDMVHLRRIESGTDWTGEYLIAFMEEARANTLPHEEEFHPIGGWKRTWGKMNISNGVLNMWAVDTTAGSFVFMDGTRAWDNYMYSVIADWKKGSHLSLVARFQDEDNYAYCTFSDSEIKIEEKIDGEISKLTVVKNNVDLPMSGVSLGMMVDEDKVKCYAGAVVAVEARGLSRELSSGGIAIRVWDAELNNADVSVKWLKAVPVNDELALLSALPVY